MGHKLLARLERSLVPRGYIRSSSADEGHHHTHREYRRFRSGGWAALELDIATGYWGSDIHVYVKIGFDSVERPPAPTLQDSGDNPAIGDRALTLGLYELAGEPSPHLSLRRGTDVDELAQRIFGDFVRLGEPFFDRVSTAEQARDFLRQR
jgi:hypothetical protein